MSISSFSNPMNYCPVMFISSSQIPWTNALSCSSPSPQIPWTNALSCSSPSPQIPWTNALSCSSPSPQIPWTNALSCSSPSPQIPWTNALSCSSPSSQTPWTNALSCSSPTSQNPWTPNYNNSTASLSSLLLLIQLAEKGRMKHLTLHTSKISTDDWRSDTASHVVKNLRWWLKIKHVMYAA